MRFFEQNDIKGWRIPFWIVGILCVLTPPFWIVQAIAYMIFPEKPFFGKQFHRRTWKYGLFLAALAAAAWSLAILIYVFMPS